MRIADIISLCVVFGDFVVDIAVVTRRCNRDRWAVRTSGMGGKIAFGLFAANKF